MLCERCRENEATIHLTTRVNGQKREIDICQNCYREIRQQHNDARNPNNPNRTPDPFGFGNFDDLFRAMSVATRPQGQRPQQGQPSQGFGGPTPPEGGQGGRGGLLGEFGINLNDMAREGKIDGVIGRDEEIERVSEILNRRRKNNPVLIGEAGVGKTAIVEGMALKIVNGEVPQKLSKKEIIQLDVSSLVSGTGIRGQFEEKMQQLVSELE